MMMVNMNKDLEGIITMEGVKEEEVVVEEEEGVAVEAEVISITKIIIT